MNMMYLLTTMDRKELLETARSKPRYQDSSDHLEELRSVIDTLIKQSLEILPNLQAVAMF
jgi:hypothetical protein